jgi:hypothetical protein
MWAYMCPGRTRGCVRCVRANPNMDQIWDTNRSRADHLSVWVDPLGAVYRFFLSARTRLDRGWSNR